MPAELAFLTQTSLCPITNLTPPPQEKQASPQVISIPSSELHNVLAALQSMELAVENMINAALITTLQNATAATNFTGYETLSNLTSAPISIANQVPSPTLAPAPFVANSTNQTSQYIFNPRSTRNVAVYFGQTAITGSTTLEAQCADPSIDIVILAFVISALYQGSLFPAVNFGAACGGQTPQMKQTAPGFLYCPELAANISMCQKTYGKKVLLSVGGATGDIAFQNAKAATDFADVLWRVFGPAGQIGDGLRVFGDVSVDGFDIGLSPFSFFSTSYLSERDIGWERDDVRDSFADKLLNR